MKYSIYRLSDGLIIDSKECDESQLAKNIPAGCGYVDGHHDYLSVRVDIDTKELVDHQPPQPSADHEWDSNVRRWRISSRAHTRALAIAEMQRTETKLLRCLRELSIDPDNVQAKKVRDDIEARCAELRKSFAN